jgi:DNA polymerase-3 subunit alpha
MESLIKVGAFDSCETYNRKTLLENMELITSFAEKKQEEKMMGQTSLFDMGGAVDTSVDQLHIQESQEWDDKQKLMMEAELLGIYVSGHPLQKLGEIMKKLSSMTIAEIHELPTVARPEGFSPRGNDHDPSKRNMVITGMISEIKTVMTKKGDKMAIMTIEDLTSKIECMIFPKTYAEVNEHLIPHEPLVFHGAVNLSEDPKKFFLSKISHLKDESDSRVSSVRIQAQAEKLNEVLLVELQRILLSYRGTVPVHFIFETPEGRARMPLDDNYLVSPSPQMAAKINEVLNENSVHFIVDGKVEEVNA